MEIQHTHHLTHKLPSRNIVTLIAVKNRVHPIFKSQSQIYETQVRVPSYKPERRRLIHYSPFPLIFYATSQRTPFIFQPASVSARWHTHTINDSYGTHLSFAFQVSRKSFATLPWALKMPKTQSQLESIKCLCVCVWCGTKIRLSLTHTKRKRWKLPDFTCPSNRKVLKDDISIH